MENILRSNRGVYTKKIALLKCLKEIESEKLEPSEEARLNCLLQSKLYAELAKESMEEYKKMTVKEYSKKDCKNEIPVGKYYELHDGKGIIKSNRSRERERERERERAEAPDPLPKGERREQNCEICNSSTEGNEPLKDEPTTKKCDDCQQDKKPNELTAIQDQGKDIKVCADCKQKRDDQKPPQDDPNRKPDKPNLPPNPQEESKKFGADFKDLKPQQQEDRKTVDDKWKNEYTKKPDYQRSSLCPYCQTNISYDKSKENFLDAKTQVKNQLEAHKKVCPKKGQGGDEHAEIPNDLKVDDKI
ncbi:hypothetical protein C1645_834756 [Glomus cerebriforme]|uniref:Uncharacterized protein n=1 Tax=Glomus cerebriforme TaxID=658196 RepID=A0A397SDN9_9GLOM|nr:hypothetical protein C1645_834756 [Glomus cerebriforme]